MQLRCGVAVGNSETPGPGGHGVQWSRRKLTPPPRHSRPPLICAVHDPGAAEAKAERCPCGWSCRAPRPEALSPPLLVAGWSVSTESRCGEAPALGRAGRGEARPGSRAPGAGARGRQALRARQRGLPRRWVGSERGRAPGSGLAAAMATLAVGSRAAFQAEGCVAVRARSVWGHADWGRVADRAP